MGGKRDTEPPMFFAVNDESRIRPDHRPQTLKKMIDNDFTDVTGGSTANAA